VENSLLKLNMKNGLKKPTTKAQKQVIDGEVIETKKPKTIALAKRETAVVETNQSAESLISQAINKGVSVENMERLMAMRREMKQEYAKEEFDRAMSKFQSECPIIKKTKTVLNKDKSTARYKYAPLDSIMNQVKNFIQANGFSYSINAKVDKDLVTAICKVTHRAGHSESSEFQIPIDPEAYMNQQQKFASALTFAKRYSFCNAFGILTGDEDDDGKTAGEIIKPVENKVKEKPKNNVDYLGQLKTVLFKNGGKNESEALKLYNDYAGGNERTLKVDQEKAKKMLWNLLNSPMGAKLKK